MRRNRGSVLAGDEHLHKISLGFVPMGSSIWGKASYSFRSNQNCKAARTGTRLGQGSKHGSNLLRLVTQEKNRSVPPHHPRPLDLEPQTTSHGQVCNLKHPERGAPQLVGTHAGAQDQHPNPWFWALGRLYFFDSACLFSFPTSSDRLVLSS